MLRWMVPIDDTNTMTIGWRYFNKQLDPRGQDTPSEVGKETIDFMGQTSGRPYEEQQRQPGDYEVQVSQRPIAVHALEHKVTSDRGVSKLRKTLQNRVRAHDKTGDAPMPSLNEANTVSTYCQDTVYPVNQVSEDEKLMKTFGGRIADAVLQSDSLSSDKRVGFIEEICKNEF